MAAKPLRCSFLLTTQELDFQGLSFTLAEGLGAALSRVLAASPQCSLCVLPGMELPITQLRLAHPVTLQGSPGTILKLAGSLLVEAPVRLCELTLVATMGMEQALVQTIADVELSDCSLLGASQVVARDCCVTLTSCRLGQGNVGLKAQRASIQLERCSFNKQTHASMELDECHVSLQGCAFNRLEGHGVILSQCQSIFVEDCAFDRIKGSALLIRDSDQPVNLILRKNKLTSCGEDGFALKHLTGDVLISSNNAEGLGGSACKLECIRGNVLLSANIWVHCGCYGLFLIDSPARVENCQCYEMRLGGLLLAPGEQTLSVVRVVAVGNQEFAICAVLDRSNVLVEGCNIASNLKDGVRVTGLNESAEGRLELRRCQVRRNRGYGLAVTGAGLVLVDSQVEHNGLANVAAEARDLVESQGSVSILQASNCTLQ